MENTQTNGFPYFFVGTFIEADTSLAARHLLIRFPYFFVGTFIEAAEDYPVHH